MRRMLMLLSIVGVLFSCDVQKKENAQLKLKVDSLKEELQTNQKMMQTLQEVGVLIDSIDANRFVLHNRMEEGTSFDDYTSRLKDISQYVQQAQDRIVLLENKVNSMKGSTAGFTSTIAKLKADLEKRNQEFIALQETVTKYRNENDNLLQTVNLQESELTDKLAQLKTKEAEIIKLEKDVSDLMVKSKIDEGEAYYARAVAVEEAARRTHFAPKKKRNTRREALELYKMAALYGKDEAQVKIAELEKKI